MNPVEIEEAVTQLASEPFDRAEFPFQFLTAFGNKKTTIDRLRKDGKGGTNQSDLASGVLQRSNIHIATCGTGDVGKALTALDVTAPGPFTVPSLKTAPPIALWNRGNPDSSDGKPKSGSNEAPTTGLG